MEILEEFGFQPSLFIAQIINFLILAYIFKRFLYKPVLKILKERQEKIKKSIQDAEKTVKLLEETEKEKEDVLKKTRIEADKIIDDAKKIADETRAKILEDSRMEAEKIIKEAKVQATAEMEKMEKRISMVSLDLSKKILNNIISTLFSDKEKEEVLERSSKQLTKILKNE